jgi:LEA14-like dessication related protein
MKKSSLIITAVLGAVALFFYSRMASAKSIKVYFSSLDIGKIIGFSLPEMFAKFRIVNPTNTALSVSALAGDIYVNDKPLASISQIEKLEIPAKQEIIYKVKISTPIISALPILISLVKKKQKIKITYSGTINSAGVLIPIEDTIYQS